jgi:Zn-dependent membrane protease YugP
MFFFHPADLLMIPALLLTLWAQSRVTGAYKKFSGIYTRSGLTGAEVAARILQGAQVHNVDIETVAGELTDHYDSEKKKLRLSQNIHGSNSIAAVGVAAHEAGHALQDAESYGPMRLRHAIYPLSSLGSTLAFPLILIGLLVNFSWAGVLIQAGIWLFTAAVAFTLITLPVEFDASRRAVKILSASGQFDQAEIAGVRKVLNAAALTYVAAAATAALQLLRLVLIAQRRR